MFPDLEAMAEIDRLDEAVLGKGAGRDRVSQTLADLTAWAIGLSSAPGLR